MNARTRSFRGMVTAVEAFGWLIAFFLAYGLRTSSWFDDYEPIAGALEQLPFLALGFGGWVTVQLVKPERSSRVQDAWHDLGAVLRDAVLVTAILLAVIFALRADYSRLLIAIWVSTAPVINFGFRRIILSIARKSDGFERRIAIVGDGQMAHQIATSIRNHPEWGWEIAGAVPITTGNETPQPSLGTLEDIRRIVEENVIDEVLFVVGTANLQSVERAFLQCEEVGVSTRLILDFFPHKISHMTLDPVDGFPALAFEATRGSDVQRILKRAFDIVVSLGFLLPGAPVFALVALAVRLDGPGPILFRQERVGRHGRPFTLYKFRSMVPEAEKMKAELMDKNEREGPAFKMSNDPRVTRIGRFIRKTSLDEIPQFYNVLIGDMSIVGPRPPLPDEVSRYDRWQRRRLSVRPGITCLWQISGRGDVDFETWMRLDLSYIDNWSIWLDLKIFLLTIPAVLGQRGSS